MLPGIGVIYDTVDYAVKEAGAEGKTFLGILDSAVDGLITTAYARGDACHVIEHGKCNVLLASGGAAVVPGDGLVTNADGKFIKNAVGALGEQGPFACYALESRNPAASDLHCLAMVTGAREPMAAA